jgi:hypothetical protein
VNPFTDCENILCDAENTFSAEISVGADPVIIINPEPEFIVMLGPARIEIDPLYPFKLVTDGVLPLPAADPVIEISVPTVLIVIFGPAVIVNAPRILFNV